MELFNSGVGLPGYGGTPYKLNKPGAFEQGWREGLEYNSISMMSSYANRYTGSGFDDEEDFMHSPYGKMGLTYDPDYTNVDYENILLAQRRERQYSKLGVGGKIAHFGGSIAAEILEPVNYIPVAGTAAMGVKALGKAGIAGGRILHGAAAGAAGGFVPELIKSPLYYDKYLYEQNKNPGLMTGLQVGAGTAFGSALGAGTGYFSKQFDNFVRKQQGLPPGPNPYADPSIDPFEMGVVEYNRQFGSADHTYKGVMPDVSPGARSQAPSERELHYIREHFAYDRNQNEVVWTKAPSERIRAQAPEQIWEGTALRGDGTMGLKALPDLITGTLDDADYRYRINDIAHYLDTGTWPTYARDTIPQKPRPGPAPLGMDPQTMYLDVDTAEGPKTREPIQYSRFDGSPINDGLRFGEEYGLTIDQTKYRYASASEEAHELSAARPENAEDVGPLPVSRRSKKPTFLVTKSTLDADGNLVPGKAVINKRIFDEVLDSQGPIQAINHVRKFGGIAKLQQLKAMLELQPRFKDMVNDIIDDKVGAKLGLTDEFAKAQAILGALTRAKGDYNDVPRLLKQQYMEASIKDGMAAFGDPVNYNDVINALDETIDTPFTVRFANGQEVNFPNAFEAKKHAIEQYNASKEAVQKHVNDVNSEMNKPVKPQQTGKEELPSGESVLNEFKNAVHCRRGFK